MRLKKEDATTKYFACLCLDAFMTRLKMWKWNLFGIAHVFLTHFFQHTCKYILIDAPNRREVKLIKPTREAPIAVSSFAFYLEPDWDFPLSFHVYPPLRFFSMKDVRKSGKFFSFMPSFLSILEYLRAQNNVVKIENGKGSRHCKKTDRPSPDILQVLKLC